MRSASRRVAERSNPGRSRVPPAGLGRLPEVSTRKLIFAALLCGMAILVAFTVQVLIAT